MEHIVDIPAATLDYDQILAESDPLKRDALLDEADWQKELQRSAWERIVTAPRFAALMFEQRGDWPLTLILHPSTRPGIDLQLSRFDWAGRPEGHGDFFILLMARKRGCKKVPPAKKVAAVSKKKRQPLRICDMIKLP